MKIWIKWLDYEEYLVCKPRDSLSVMLNCMIYITLKLNMLYVMVIFQINAQHSKLLKVKCKFFSWVQMVAKQCSSLVLQTEGQVMAERPKNNCCFATSNHPWNETPLLSFLKLPVQYKIVIKSTYKISSHSAQGGGGMVTST